MGNYASIEAGDPVDSGMALIGTPGKKIYTDFENVDQIWDTVRGWDARDYIMSAWTSVDGPGLIGGHAYTFVHSYVLSNGARVFKLRNPWGASEWSGDYRDSDPFWASHRQDAELVGHTDVDDGTFIMTVEDFKKHFYACSMNYDPENWHQAYWLAIGDGDQVGEPG